MKKKISASESAFLAKVRSTLVKAGCVEYKKGVACGFILSIIGPDCVGVEYVDFPNGVAGRRRTDFHLEAYCAALSRLQPEWDAAADIVIVPDHTTVEPGRDRKPTTLSEHARFSAGGISNVLRSATGLQATIEQYVYAYGTYINVLEKALKDISGKTEDKAIKTAVADALSKGKL